MSNSDSSRELIQLVYTSAASETFNLQRFCALLETARANNQRMGITGMLLHEGGSFFQILEGRRDVVEALFERISIDSEHRRVSKIFETPIEKRSFADWTMGCAEVTREELQSIDGLNDFFADGHSLLELSESQARSLLSAFREGRWRNAISNEGPDPGKATAPKPRRTTRRWS